MMPFLCVACTPLHAIVRNRSILLNVWLRQSCDENDSLRPRFEKHHLMLMQYLFIVSISLRRCCEGSQARSKARDSRSLPEVVRRFKSGPSHCIIVPDEIRSRCDGDGFRPRSAITLEAIGIQVFNFSSKDEWVVLHWQAFTIKSNLILKSYRSIEKHFIALRRCICLGKTHSTSLASFSTEYCSEILPKDIL